jgi:hypothetical protein
MAERWQAELPKVLIFATPGHRADVLLRGVYELISQSVSSSFVG